MLNAYIYGGLRTPFGKHSGALSSVRPDDLLANVLKKLTETYSFDVNSIEDIIIGATNQAGEDARNIARNALLVAGMPVTVSGQTVNRLCASGLQAIINAAYGVSCGEGDLYIAGGVESMSRAPFVIAKSEAAFSRNFTVFDSTIGARFPNLRLIETYGNDSMPETGDNVAIEYGISREEADLFAFNSQKKYQKAKESGFFDDEIISILVPQGRRGETVEVNEDEHPRINISLESLAKLRSLNNEGIVTAGNASGVNDGAAALFVGSHDIGKKNGIKPIAKILSSATSGVEPRVMGVGPVEAITKAISRANLTLADIDIIEINEAFATQVLSCLKLLNISFDDPRVNPNGGAIAVGHPLGASGARLVLTTARELVRTSKRYAVISLCIGVGQGLAMVIERV
ncbi:acetyl-CoA acetyltransferase [Ignatzschineria indica]|uniref:acetyl-CoA C-acyltransferase n=1 Tax=Ignatzschineria indica TaxID=472583 RepID=A0A2U2AIZ8_9GAMM|nr:3-oxoadipyl-CoA thiolase [Ignatzschineria indica]PWD82632.1 3-oxoadipyl-CoA thiolase [Ignatzschineria indica]GGZ85444.1 acetyl-CoA acetyltransferase [Ignatzschineria indica]